MLIFFGSRKSKHFFLFLCIFYSRKFLSPDTMFDDYPGFDNDRWLAVDSVPDDLAHILNK